LSSARISRSVESVLAISLLSEKEFDLSKCKTNRANSAIYILGQMLRARYS
jgi:hypothetical protein